MPTIEMKYNQCKVCCMMNCKPMETEISVVKLISKISEDFHIMATTYININALPSKLKILLTKVFLQLKEQPIFRIE